MKLTIKSVPTRSCVVRCCAALCCAVAQMLWYWWIRNLLAFAATILRTALAALRANPGPFAAALGLFVLQAVWCIIFVGALFKVAP
jgi:hypothetical protein